MVRELVPTMLGEIKRVATEMLIRHGYRGFRFQQIADELNITRGNVHYHFGNKEKLAEEAIVDYCTVTMVAFRNVWLSQTTSLQTKIRQTMQLNRQRYLAFNPTGRTGKPWSLIGCMRLEHDLLTEAARRALADFGEKIGECMEEGVRTAIRKGDLREDAPVEEIVLQLVAIANSAGPITQDAGSFDRLEQLYLGFARIVDHAYGARAEPIPRPAGGRGAERRGAPAGNRRPSRGM